MRLRSVKPPPTSPSQPSDYVELFSAAACRPRGAAAAAAGAARAHPRAARSAADRKATAWYSADSSREHGRRKAGPTPGSAGRCARSSASTCPSAASGFRRTILPNCSARATWSSPAPPSLPARRPCHRASSSGSPRLPGRSGRRWSTAATLSRLRARARPPGRDRARAAPGADAAARRAACAPAGDRHRALAARSLYDLRQAHPAPARRSMRSTRRRAPPSAATSSTPPSANSPQRFASALPADRGARTHRAGPDAFRRGCRVSRGAGVVVAALRAHRALVRGLGAGAAPGARRD